MAKINTNVFSVSFRGNPDFEAWLKIFELSPALITMLNRFEEMGGKVTVGASGNGVYFNGTTAVIDAVLLPNSGLKEALHVGTFATAIAGRVSAGIYQLEQSKMSY
jgi:hypothetical protein